MNDANLALKLCVAGTSASCGAVLTAGIVTLAGSTEFAGAGVPAGSTVFVTGVCNGGLLSASEGAAVPAGATAVRTERLDRKSVV